MYQSSQYVVHHCEGPVHQETPHHYGKLEQIAHSVSPIYESSGSYSAPRMYHNERASELQNAYAHSFQPVVPQFSPSSYLALDHLRRSYAEKSVYEIFKVQPEYHFQPDSFLKPGKGLKFIGRAEEIREFIEEAFEKIFDYPFPDDIKISICNERQFRTLAPHASTIGLSINRRKQGLLSEIFVLNDTLGRVMLTFGHELGHVLTETLDNEHDEEAKAYAFSLLWIDVVQKYNIAGLGNALITEMPAENGLHNVAFRFVQKLLRAGQTIEEIYRGLIHRMIRIRSAEFLLG